MPSTKTMLHLAVAGLIAAWLTPGGGALAASTSEMLYASLGNVLEAERSKVLEQGAKKEGTFVYIMTGPIGANGKRHGDLFAKRYPFIKVEQTSTLGSQDGAARVVTEEKAGRHLTDLVSTTVPDMSELIQENMLASNPTPFTQRVLAKYRPMLDPEHRWTPYQWSEHGISYNKKIIGEADAPKDWTDLCNPALKGQVSFDPAETRFLVGLYYIFGQDLAKVEALLQCIGKNEPIIQRGHSSRMQLMLAGDHGVGGDQSLYFGESLRRKAPDKSPFVAVYTAPLMAYAAGSAINKNAPHPHAAALFADWALTEESQDYIASLMRGPLAIPHPFVPETAQLVAFGYSDKKLEDALQRLWVTHVSAAKY